MKTKNNLNNSKLPKIILTTGDPNGIGPEIILKIFNDKNYFLTCLEKLFIPSRLIIEKDCSCCFIQESENANYLS